jgi:hypothetical protein
MPLLHSRAEGVLHGVMSQRLSTAQKFKVHLLAAKIMASVFLDSEGLVHVDFLQYYITINAQHYINLLCNVIHQMI